MSVLHSLLRGWFKLRHAASIELLRDPHVILFEREAGQAPEPIGEGERAA